MIVSQFLVVPLTLALLSGCWSVSVPTALPGGDVGNKADTGLETELDTDVLLQSRQKRSLGLLANMFNRIMFSEVQDHMEEVFPEEAPEETIKVVKCSLVLERKTCRIGDTETVCKNYFGRQCFLYTYPSTTVTVEHNEATHTKP